MTDNTVYVKKYTPFQVSSVDEKEVWRYAGYFKGFENIDETLRSLLIDVTEEVLPVLTYKVCYRRFDIEWLYEQCKLPFEQKSKKLSDCLKGCNEIIIMAATVGIELDRRITRAQRIAPSRALIMQALGAERIEALCDQFLKEYEQVLAGDGLKLSKRFSPGYGDLPLETQVDVFKLLDCPRQIGVSLNNSLLMTPSKSVTAIVGIGANAENCLDKKCTMCDKLDCEFRNA